MFYYPYEGSIRSRAAIIIKAPLDSTGLKAIYYSLRSFRCREGALLSWLSIRCRQWWGKDCSEREMGWEKSKRIDSSRISLISVDKVIKMKQLKNLKKIKCLFCW